MKSYFSPKFCFQKSAASLFVILNVSPAKDPLGKTDFNSLSMWLNTKLNLVKFLWIMGH